MINSVNGKIIKNLRKRSSARIMNNGKKYLK